MEGPSKGLKKGAWTAEEDSLLRQCIDMYGEGKWHQVPLRAGLNRCRKSCRLRWLNYLKPDIKRGKLSSDEVDLLLRLHKLLGNRWSLIAGRLPGRTANDVKNYWNTHVSKKIGPSCKTKMKKRNIIGSCSTTTDRKTVAPAQKIDALKPRPRSFIENQGCSGLNGHPKFDISPPYPGLNSNNVSESNITCNKDKEKYDELVNNQVDGETMWWESMFDADPVVPEARETENKTPFDVEGLWNLLDEEVVEKGTSFDDGLWSLLDEQTVEKGTPFDVEGVWSLLDEETPF